VIKRLANLKLKQVIRQMKNIAIDARFLLRQQRGMPMYVYMLCKGLPDLMPDVHFYFLINKMFEHNDIIENYSHRLEEVGKPQNVTVINADAEDEVSWEVFVLPKLLKQYHIDLLHMPGNRVCLTARTPQIVTFHDAMEWTRLKMFEGIAWCKGIKPNLYSLKMKIYCWITYYFGSKKASHILTISDYSRSSLVNCFPGIKNKTSYVHHGIPEDFVHLKEQKMLGERSGILMLGGDSYQKNPVNAIKAWAQLPISLRQAYPLTIAGFTGDESSPLMKAIKQLDIEREVTIKSWVAHDEIIRLFNDSVLFLFVSREEGFGFPLIQAMSSGTPTVCSTADVLTEIGKESVLSADAESADEISAQMYLILTNQKLWQKLHVSGLRRANEFSWAKTYEHISGLYRQYLEKC